MMYDVFDANEILYNILNVDEINSFINGKIYNDNRPLNSFKEDVVVNTITITQAYKPQIATSNINVYAKDVSLGIKNSVRLKEISRKVTNLIANHIFLKKSVYILSQNIIREVNNEEHFLNIRLQWNIYDNK